MRARRTGDRARGRGRWRAARVARFLTVAVLVPLLAAMAGGCRGKESAKGKSNVVYMGDSTAAAPGPSAASYELQGYFRVDALQLALLEARADELRDALPISVAQFEPLDEGDQWGRWAQANARNVPRDTREMVRILEAPARLADGRVVTQEFNEGVGIRTSAVACTAQGARILYDPHAIAGLLPPQLLFLKHHEIAHLQLRHLRCGEDPAVDTTYSERDADCRAVATLIALGRPGEQAIDMAAAYFAGLRYRGVKPYEAPGVRGSYLYHRCEPGA